jgi:hypothetical protein
MTSTANHRYPRIEGEDEAARYPRIEGEDEAARAAELEFEDEEEFEDESAYEDEAFLGGIAQALGGLLGEEEAAAHELEFEFEAEAEREDEGEAEDEAEGFVNPVRRIYPDAELMAHLSARAAQAESEAEAEAFASALVPLAAQLIPRAAALIRGHAPTLIRGTVRLAGQLRQQPGAARLVRTLPVVLQRSAQSLADQAAAGRPVTPGAVLGTLVTIAQRLLSDPADCRGALSAVGTFDRRYHQRHQGRASSAVARGVRPASRPRAAGAQPRRRAPGPAARRARRRRS